MCILTNQNHGELKLSVWFACKEYERKFYFINVLIRWPILLTCLKDYKILMDLKDHHIVIVIYVQLRIFK